MGRIFAALYSAFAYLLFLGTFVHAIGFVENIMVRKTIDSGAASGAPGAILVDLALLGVFAVQHSVMARKGFKRVWTRIVPEAVERSTYVLFSSLALALLLWQWQPIPQLVWSTDGALAIVLPLGPPSPVRRFHHRVLGGTADERGTPAVRSRDYGLHPAGDLAGGARPGGALRPALSAVSGAV